MVILASFLAILKAHLRFGAIFFICLTWSELTLAYAQPDGKDLVPRVFIYRGAGACEGCEQTLNKLARTLGQKTQYVSAKEISAKSLTQADVWVQPGGDALELARVISKEKMSALREFIFNGGSYVGFCAGAFFADQWIDDNKTVQGLGVLAGETYDFLPTETATVLPISWGTEVREMYHQGGPAFRLNFNSDSGSSAGTNSNVAILARYSDSAPAIIEYSYGKGKVILVGPHPEATEKWFQADGLKVPGRLSDDLAMVLLNKAAN